MDGVSEWGDIEQRDQELTDAIEKHVLPVIKARGLEEPYWYHADLIGGSTDGLSLVIYVTSETLVDEDDDEDD